LYRDIACIFNHIFCPALKEDSIKEEGDSRKGNRKKDKGKEVKGIACDSFYRTYGAIDA